MENLIEKIAELNPKAITLEGLDKANSRDIISC